MFNLQYRCHSDIMSIFNQFYGGKKYGLQIGVTGQDNLKQHNLSVKIKDLEIISPKEHVCFIDCQGDVRPYYEGSTSLCNKVEADVVSLLLTSLNDAASKMTFKNPDVKKPSIGIITLYDDQRKMISQNVKNFRLEGFNDDNNEKLTIDTVDSFQGDERDIIILSMVRNSKSKTSNFSTNYKRINVALSRARKLLIIVGSKKYLSNETIDVYDIQSGDSFKKETVFNTILKEIEDRGKIINGNQLLRHKYEQF